MPRPYASLAACLVLLASVAALATAWPLAASYDEPAHVAAGLQWWQAHRFSYEPLTPPLARVVVAFLPWLDGIRSQGMPDVWAEGRAVLQASGDPARVLLLARCGTLIFLAWSAAVAWHLTRRTAAPGIAAIAVAFLVSLPPILGNAGMAATDLAQAATFSTLIAAFLAYVKARSRHGALWLGIAAGLALVTKFTTAVLFPAAVAGLLIWRLWIGGRSQRWLPDIGMIRQILVISVPVMLLVIWAAYCFGVGSLQPEASDTGLPTSHIAGSGWLHTIAAVHVFPAHEFWRGLIDAFHRDGRVESEYLLGDVHPPSIWFFPVAFLIKTPIPHLALITVGVILNVVRARRTRDWQIGATAVVAASVFAAAGVAVPHHGLRYILSVYVMLSVPAAQAVAVLWNAAPLRGSGRILAVAAAAWAGFVVIDARGDYLGWFNALTGSDPGWFETSDDLTWFENVGLVAATLRELQATDVKLRLSDYPYPDELRRVGMPAYTSLPPDTRVGGWIVIDRKELVRNSGYQWLRDFTPVAVVAHAFMVYDLR